MFAISQLSPLWKGWALHLNKLESSSSKDDLCQVWLKLAQWFWRRRFLKLSMYFRSFVTISPWKRASPFILTNLNSLHSRLCAKFGWNWPSGSWEEVENRKNLQTDGQTDRQKTDERWSEKLTCAFSSGELKNTGTLFLYQNQQNVTLQPLMAWIRDFRLWIAFLSCRLSSQNTGNTIV